MGTNASRTGCTEFASESSDHPGRIVSAMLPGPMIVFVLLLLLILVYLHLGISLRVDGLTLIGLYLAIGIQSSAYAVLLIAVQFPAEYFLPAIQRLVRRPEAVITAVALGVLFFRIFPLMFAVPAVVLVPTLFATPSSQAKKVIRPGIYLLAGLFTAFGYNVAAVTVRFQPNFDGVLQKADRFLLLGHSVSELSHRFAQAVPPFVTVGLLAWYALMFAQVGATLMLCATLVSREYAMRFVSAILVGYFITVSIFFVFPTHSPYFTCPDHASSALPKEMVTIQQQFVATATGRFHGSRAPLGPEYYISFPCMHIAQPLIAMWFLRRWKRISVLLGIVNAILAFAIVILEWHYVTDMIGGVVVAALAIWMVGRSSRSRQTLQVA